MRAANLHALDIARVGGTLRLHARHRCDVPSLALCGGGPPGAAAVARRARVALPRPGQTRCARAAHHGSIALVVTLALPSDPRLVGLTLHVQVAFLPSNVADWRLSGLVSEPILR